MSLAQKLFTNERMVGRVFLLVVGLMLVPALLVGWVGQNTLEKQLHAYHDDRVAELVKEAALTTAQKIRTLNSVLSGIAAGSEKLGAARQGSAAPPRRDELGISRIRYLSTPEVLLEFESRDAGALFSRWAAQPDGLEAILLVGVSDRSLPETAMVLVRAVDRDRNRFLLAQVAPEYLFPADDFLDESLRYCATLGSYTARFCAAMGPDFEGALRSSLERSYSGPISVTGVDGASGSALRGRYWSIDHIPDIEVPMLSIAAVGASADMLSDVRRDNLMIAALIAATVVFGLLISLQIIRRQLRPLKQLTHAAHKISDGNFFDSVRIDSADEFSELGEVFEEMRRSLGNQFRQLSVLARIDRLILENSELEPIARTALNEANKLIGDNCWIALSTASEDVSLQVYTSDSQFEYRPKIALADFLRLRTGEHEPAPRNIETIPMVSEDGVIPTGANMSHALPIRVGGSVMGVAALDSSENPSKFAKVTLKALADRMAIAVQSIEREAELVKQGLYDSLTGLPNRRLFSARTSEKLACCMSRGEVLRLLFLDLDGFKQINDAEGHSAGDRVLQVAAERIKSAIGGENTAARFGGDEFAILLGNAKDANDVTAVCESVLEALGHPFIVGTRRYFISVSIGIAEAPSDGADVDALLKNADIAMYAAKEQGGSRAVQFQVEMAEKADALARIDEDLRAALERGELRLDYQPQIDLIHGGVVGAEALMRWYDPKRGYVSPFEFVTLAEKTGFIVDLGAWALERVCADYQRLCAAGIQLPSLSVNVSGQQFKDGGFIETIHRALYQYDIPTGVLKLEVTETVFVDDIAKTQEIFRQLHQIGVLISIDDFGTGYSSLSYLRDLDFDNIKIDRAFIQDLPDSGEACALVKALLAMASGVKKEVVAEGIETAAQADYLIAHGCQVAQGFLYSKAIPLDEFIVFVTEFNKASASYAPTVERLEKARLNT